MGRVEQTELERLQWRRHEARCSERKKKVFVDVAFKMLFRASWMRGTVSIIGEVVSVLRYIGVMGGRREFRKGERGNREVERGGLRGFGGRIVGDGRFSRWLRMRDWERFEYRKCTAERARRSAYVFRIYLPCFP